MSRIHAEPVDKATSGVGACGTRVTCCMAMSAVLLGGEVAQPDTLGQPARCNKFALDVSFRSV